jgi:hypothetical protein
VEKLVSTTPAIPVANIATGTAGVVDINFHFIDKGGVPSLASVSANFQKNSK